jgi:hypothetical protein
MMTVKSLAALRCALALAVTHWFAYRHGAASRDGEVAQLDMARVNLEKVYASLALEAQKQISAQQTARQQGVAAADQRATQEIEDAKRKYQTDLAAVRSGTLGVRLNGANCTAASGSAVSAAATATGVADAAGGSLPESVATDVLDLRVAIEHDAAQIAGLQGYIRAITGAESATLTAP